jgi:hypothetical protein
VRPLDHLMATASGLRGRTLEIENEHDDENENDLGGDFEDVECRNPDRLTYSRQAVPACFRGAGAEEVRRPALPTSSQTKRQSGDALRTRTYAVMSSLVKVPLTRRQILRALAFCNSVGNSS